ncbi:hypothetical protein [Mycobacterium sp. SMC-17]|uniref:hypothetical protein n=1 Tax=Mycobacterium sp. SMC-17 TaxID=3381628 RepID=UPI003876286F
MTLSSIEIVAAAARIFIPPGHAPYFYGPTLSVSTVDIHLCDSEEMPSQHRVPAGIYRADEALRKRAIAAAAEVDSCLSAHINGFLLWLVGDTDELPPRPIPQRADGPNGAARQCTELGAE